MKKKVLLRNVMHFCLSFIVAGLVLNFVLYGYYRRPPKITVQAATDKIWQADSVIIDRTEGFGTVRTDANGYNNAFVPSDVDNYILLMGSSHTQAINVDGDQNYAYLLTERIHNAGINTSVYNVGFDGNEFVTVIEHFKAAMEQFDDASDVIVEIYKVDYSAKRLRDALARQIDYNPAVGHSPKPLWEKAVNFVQSMPLARLIYSRTYTFRIDIDSAFIAKYQEAPAEIPCPPDYADAVNEVIAAMKKEAGDRRLLLLYNPMMMLQKDGTVIAEPFPGQIEAISRACEENGVLFHDMTSGYVNLYNEHRLAAHGFANNKIVTGHLNANGHGVIAEELFDIVKEWYED